MEYEKNTTFNTYVDDLHEVISIFESEYQPSDVLFSVDLEAYRDALATFVPPSDALDTGAPDYGEEV
jgi:hypothetical protein